MFINRAGRIDQPGIYRSGCIRHDRRHNSAAQGARTHLSSLQRLNSGIGIASTLAELLQKSVLFRLFFTSLDELQVFRNGQADKCQ